MKGIETMTTFALTVEADVFSRFDSARAFASWLGLVSSEHSSGERTSRGGITKAGNSHLRKLLVEASWHYTRATKERKRSLPYRTMQRPVSSALRKGVAIYLASCASDLWSQTSLQRASWLAGYGRSGA